jgi:hypothetical protein
MAKDRPVRREKRKPLNALEKKQLMGILLRRRTTFLSAKDKLSVEHFHPSEDRVISLLWEKVNEYFDEFDELPNADEITVALQTYLDTYQDYLTEEQIEEADDFIDWAYGAKLKDLRHRVGVSYLRRLLEERIYRDLQQHMQSADIDEDLPELLRESQKQVEMVHSVSSGRIPLLFADGLGGMEPLDKVSTGLPFFDKYMNGGQVDGEIYGFLGPYGTCKTLLGVQLCMERAKWEQSMRGDEDKAPRVYLVAYEETMKSLKVRCLSYVAGIPRDTLEQFDINKLSTSENLKPYEKKRYASQIANGKKVLGETERLEKAYRIINRNVRVIDFTGSNPDFAADSGNMATGIANVIRNDQMMDDNPGVSMVAVDYAGAAAHRSCVRNNLNPDRLLRHLVGSMPMALKAEVAAPFDCPVWVLHQLTAEVNSRAPGVAPKSTDSAEAKNFFENCDFGFMVGSKAADGHVVLTNHKFRRSEKRPDVVLFIDGAFCAVRDTEGEYIIQDKKIVNAAEYRNIADDDDILDSTNGQFTNNALFTDIGV